ncbi:hypothetical protein PspLS_11494 [Pyricularia sp. CBS 133598]|nr:hypothetical protein PspLS_11494 [Pyricularia sp. CBS 133598]
MTSDKHPFLALMSHLPKSLQVPENVPFGCIAGDPLQQCEWVSRLLIPTYSTASMAASLVTAIVYVDHSAVANKEIVYAVGISKTLKRLKDFLRHGNSKVNNLVARDNRSNAIPLPLEASSVADASHNSSRLPERTSNPNPMAPPTALPVPTTLETTSSAALSIIPLSQIMPPAKRHREADTFEREPRITPEDFTVGWVCALPIELAAVAEMMDEEFADLPSNPTDSNIYSFGRMGNHNVVAACLPAVQTTVFPNAKFRLSFKPRWMCDVGGFCPILGQNCE